MTFSLYLRLMLTGALLFMFVIPLLKMTPEQASTKLVAVFQILVVLLFTIATVLFFGGGYGMIWTLPL